MIEHEKFMRRCLQLAEYGLPDVSPNPMVGAVVVHQGSIIGEGFHQKFGEAHAEVNAIRNVYDNFKNANELLSSSTIYVNLEPCAHYGKTPPCADLIISKKIPRVIIGCADPFADVDGKGISKLREADVEVVVGVLEKEALFLNRRFFTRIKKQRPYIILKWAETADGFFAPENGKQKWISGKEAKKLVHKWRTEEDAVLVGKNTVSADNPQLNSRLWKGKNPVRIIIDKDLELSRDLHVFDQQQTTIVFNGIKTETEGKLKYLALEDFDHYLPQMIAYQLYLFDIQSVIIEGGAKTLQLFLAAGLWDEARVFSSKETWGSGIKAPRIAHNPSSIMPIGTDQLNLFYNT